MRVVILASPEVTGLACSIVPRAGPQDELMVPDSKPWTLDVRIFYACAVGLSRLTLRACLLVLEVDDLRGVSSSFFIQSGTITALISSCIEIPLTLAIRVSSL